MTAAWYGPVVTVSRSPTRVRISTPGSVRNVTTTSSVATLINSGSRTAVTGPPFGRTSARQAPVLAGPRSARSCDPLGEVWSDTWISAWKGRRQSHVIGAGPDEGLGLG